MNAPDHPADRLLRRICELKAPICVGLDPVLDRLPDSLKPPHLDPNSAVSAIRDFCLGVLDAISGLAPCIKIQSACFERYGHLGVRELEFLIAEAETRNLEVILDNKRGDIGISAEHYAAAAFGPESACRSQPSWVTINAYLGADGMTPFLRPGHGAFALVRTSNVSGDAIQELKLEDDRTVAQAVAGYVAQLGNDYIGESGYSALGAVVGATKPQASATLRGIMPHQIFLVPGFGAQGGGAEDVKPCFKADGSGAIVTASRSVIYAFEPDATNWTSAVREAADRFADQIGQIAGIR